MNPTTKSLFESGADAAERLIGAWRERAAALEKWAVPGSAFAVEYRDAVKHIATLQGVRDLLLS